MPRTARAVEDGGIYHVLNRGNAKMDLFHKDGDFAAFAKILAEGQERYPVEILAWCLMSNHWHLVLRPLRAEALGRFMGWIGVTHVRRHRAHYHSSGQGHLYQGRFKSFPIQADEHFLTVCRYVEANPLRAGMVKKAENWPWSSCGQRGQKSPVVKPGEWPVDRPGRWSHLVNQPLKESVMQTLQTSLTRGRPFGNKQWIEKTVARLGLEYSIRPRGRPRKTEKE